MKPEDKFKLKRIVKDSIKEAGSSFFKKKDQEKSPKKEILDQPDQVQSGDFGCGFPPVSEETKKSIHKTKNPKKKRKLNEELLLMEESVREVEMWLDDKK